MQKVSTVQEYSVVNLNNDRHKQADIGRFLTNGEVKNLAGKLKSA